MLLSLRIRNLALIDDLTWELGPGFNILTGETGAGKSILIDALSLLLGGRADKSLIRTGTEFCTVEAEMSIQDQDRLRLINQTLEELGAEPCQDAQLLLKRGLSLTTSGRQFVNGSPITLQGLKSLGDLLVDVHGPHDHQSLLNTDKQAEILDAYGKLQPQRAACASAHKTLREIEQQRAALEMSEAEREQRLSMLQHQVGEIESAQLLPEEDVRLENDYRAASHAQTLVEHARTITQLLNEAEGAVLTQLAQVEKSLLAWQRVDDSIHNAAELNRQAITQLEEMLREVEAQAERIDLDPSQLRQLEDRLNLVQSLKRKYGGSLTAVREFGQKAAEQLAALESREKTLAEINQKEKEARALLDKAAEALSKKRKEVAGPLGEKISQELHALGFAKALFKIDLAPAPQPGPTGGDRVEFIFAPNPGEAPRPLRAIASSGEMARVMLAVKTTLAEVDEIPILIFDEVDANVGGETATQVGKKLRGLGKSHQVLCITHLPQVAAQGQIHFAVEKSVQKDRTVTKLSRLEKTDRQRELARMLGGQTDAALGLAKSLLQESSH